MGSGNLRNTSTVPENERPGIFHSLNARRVERIETIIEKLRTMSKYTNDPQDLAEFEAARVRMSAIWDRWNATTVRR